MSFEHHKYINKGRVVSKPWGREIWLELNDKYCYKRIEINGGFKTSYQLHKFKLETNYLIQGEAEVWLENDEGVVEVFQMKEGDYFTVIPGRKHRVIAKTNVILQEVSTPEVDDVIRLNDEFNRSDGKVLEEHCRPVVCILAAGTGSRLGDLGKTCHKSLLPYKNKAILSYIIDQFSKDVDIVLAVGYLKDQVKEYVSLFHADRSIQFVDVDPYEGTGSGPAHSLECCRKSLQRPFYFCVSDFFTPTLLQNAALSTKNWIGLQSTKRPDLYSTVRMEGNEVKELVNKRSDGFENAFTGIFYMYDYKLFWEQFDKHVCETKEVVDVFKQIDLFKFEKKEIDWHDIGTRELYDSFLEENESKNLYLHNTKHEHKYKKDGLFIKKVDTPGKIQKLFERGQALQRYIPNLQTQGTYFYSYNYVEGNTLYSLNRKDRYLEFLDWFDRVCMSVNPTNEEKNSLASYAESFYKTKTLARLEQFKQKDIFSQLDSLSEINGQKVKPITVYLEQIPWDSVLDTIPTKLFHGDLQFDNILCDGSTFTLIDWREDFGGNTEYGDLYYDLAKLYGGMELNYNVMKDSTSFSVNVEENKATFTHYVDPILIDIQKNGFVELLNKYKISLKKIQLLVAIIYLNMSPLHINNFDVLLFLKAKVLFEKALQV